MARSVMPYAEQELNFRTQEIRVNNEKRLAQGFSVANLYLNRNYLDGFSTASILNPDNATLDASKVKLIRIDKLVLDPKERITDRLMNVYSALNTLKSSVALIIKSNGDEIEFFLGVRSDTAASSAVDLLESTLKGNFPGVNYSSLSSREINAVIEYEQNSEVSSLAAVSIVPSMRNDDNNIDSFAQGIEKFIDSMSGKKYTVVCLAVPLSEANIELSKHGYEQLYSSLSPHAKLSLSYGVNNSKSVGTSVSKSFTQSVNRSVSNSNTSSRSSSHGSNSSYGTGYSNNSGFSFDGMSSGWGSSSNSSNGSFDSYTSGTSFAQSVSDSSGTSNGETAGTNENTTTGNSTTFNMTYENKGVSDLMERANAQLKRFALCESFGMWEFCSYFMSVDSNTTALAASTYKALMTGDKSNVESSHINFWSASQYTSIRRIQKSISYLTHPTATLPSFDGFDAQIVAPTVLVSGNELPFVMGLPKKSVSGLPVVEMAEFGRTVVYENQFPQRPIDFGSIYHMGTTESNRVHMDLNLLSSHCFITGSSGSGKSYATYQLLDQVVKNDVNLMVIEPAKGEYKQIFGGLKGIKIYTTDPNAYRILKINPFQFPDSIHVLSHIEQLMQIFNASWPLYAAMPAILKQAVVDSYTKCGWDVQSSIWIPGLCDHKYPVFKDVLEVLPNIINTSDYSSDSKGDYKGALLTRVQSMTTGINGVIFKNSEGIADSMLFDSNVIVDLSELGSDEAIALIMGVLIMKLNEYRKAQRKTNNGSLNSALRHVTVLEEAHNLLKRTSKEQNQEGANMVGKSVEMISNSIKEMRTYGEGFIIIDQSPMAVDSSAIENTATKIILNTPAKDACEEVGSALSLSEEQTAELSRLNTGVAAVFQKGWLTPVLMKVDEWDNKYEKEIVVTDPIDLRKLKGELITALSEQRKNCRYSSMKLRSIIKRSSVPVDKMREFEDIVSSYSDKFQFGETFNRRYFGSLLLEICGCESLFNVIPINDVPTYEQFCKYDTSSQAFADMYNAFKNNLGEWYVTMNTALDYYVSIPDERIKAETILEMLYSIGNGGLVKYYRHSKLTMLCRMMLRELNMGI